MMRSGGCWVLLLSILERWSRWVHFFRRTGVKAAGLHLYHSTRKCGFNSAITDAKAYGLKQWLPLLPQNTLTSFKLAFTGLPFACLTGLTLAVDCSAKPVLRC